MDVVATNTFTVARPTSMRAWNQPAGSGTGAIVAERYELVAVELDLAARHLRTAARHFRAREQARGAAHAWAARGHQLRANGLLDELAELHASKSDPG
jgi:hypothetical protein